MNKSELLKWFTEEQQKWELLLAAIGPRRMDQPGVNGDWAMRDVIAHLTGWQRRLVMHLSAAANGQPEPAPYWPESLKDEKDINAWIYETNRKRSVRDVLDEARQVYEQMRSVLEGLPDDARMETIESKFHVVWVAGQRFAPGELYYHFYDDHLGDVRAWLERAEGG